MSPEIAFDKYWRFCQNAGSFDYNKANYIRFVKNEMAKHMQYNDDDDDDIDHNDSNETKDSESHYISNMNGHHKVNKYEMQYFADDPNKPLVERYCHKSPKTLKSSDIWSIGAMGYYMFCGINLFDGNNQYDIYKSIVTYP